ncbi:ABC-three component system protein [Pseudomonas sp. S1Bt23]|uniref:ABC-three component system protein n=1 Tax=Pseudomonas sp. S1Bt23 TaxID=3095074 RepID=UPI0039BD289A
MDEVSAAEFESKLHRFWKNTKSTIRISNSSLAPEDRGRLLYNECQVRQEKIKNSELPDSTVAGTYHALANGSKLGWHEDWESRLKNGK